MFVTQILFPHIFVWGSCFWLCTSARPRLAPPLRRPPLTHTHTTCTHTHTHNLSPHNLLTHNLLTHLSTHNLLTHAHTQLDHTQLDHIQLTHTHNLTTHNLLTQPQLTHTQLAHTTCSHTTCTPWQGWHLAISTITLRGRRGTWRHGRAFCVAGVTLIGLGWLWWRAWVPVGAVDAAPVCVAGVALGERHWPSLCVAGVALGDIDLHFAWQAWHLATWTCILRGRRNTYRTWLALMARLGPSWRRGRRPCLRGRRGTWRATLTVTLRGRRGTWWHRPSLCVAGVALGDMDVHSAWQA